MALFRPDADVAPDALRSAPGTVRPSAAPAEQHTVVGVSTVLEGTLRSTGNLTVSGTVNGDVHVDARTLVMPGGVVDGEVTSAEAEVAGRITGTLTVYDRLVLRPTAVIDGDIRTGALVIEEGAVFNGRCEMGALARPDTRARSAEARPSGPTLAGAAPASA
ncbi:MAG TPA: polymer-forming cytoskeletal protein [Rubricoccaceae bacterium]|jgi:cytoskeletal protein CcmA (bactofilin family)